MSYAMVKVPSGTKVGVEHWIEVLPENQESCFMFMAKKEKGAWTLTRPRWGAQEYGNGSMFLFDTSKAELITPWCLLDSPLLSPYEQFKPKYPKSGLFG